MTSVLFSNLFSPHLLSLELVSTIRQGRGRGIRESASNERYFLQAAFGRKVRIHKIWNDSRKEIKDDFYMVRAMLDETEHWDPAYESLDRILKGAGF